MTAEITLNYYIPRYSSSAICGAIKIFTNLVQYLKKQAQDKLIKKLFLQISIQKNYILSTNLYIRCVLELIQLMEASNYTAALNHLNLIQS